MSAHPGARLPEIVLASASPRRRRILERLSLPHTVDPSDVDESVLPGESAGERVVRLATGKAEHVAARHRAAWILGGDTEVVLDGVALGKPNDPADAVRMLHALSGRAHLVLSAVALVRPGAPPDVEVVATRVRMRHLDEHTVAGYVATGEPLDKAGAYGIQGLGSTLVERIDGDYTAVVGLPVVGLLRLLARAGLRWAFADGWTVSSGPGSGDAEAEEEA